MKYLFTWSKCKVAIKNIFRWNLDGLHIFSIFFFLLFCRKRCAVLAHTWNTLNVCIDRKFLGIYIRQAFFFLSYPIHDNCISPSIKKRWIIKSCILSVSHYKINTLNYVQTAIINIIIKWWTKHNLFLFMSLASKVSYMVLSVALKVSVGLTH